MPVNVLLWTNQANVETLRSYLVAVRSHRPRVTPRLISQEIGSAVKERAMANFLTGVTSSLQQVGALDALARWAIKFDQEHRCDEARAHPCYANFEKLAAAMAVDDVTQGKEPSPQDIGLAFSILTSLMGIKPEALKALQESVFKASDRIVAKQRSERYFVCYRYAATPGKIARSFLVMMGKSKATPDICRFANFYRSAEGAERQANGFALPFPMGVYFLGESGGSGMKLLVVREFSDTGAHDGLLLSYDDPNTDGEMPTLVASRVLLLDSKKQHHAQANIGVFDEDEVRAELGSHFGRLRNEVAFALNAPILFDGRPIDQRQMVDAVSDALTLNGEPRFTYADPPPQREFNPARTADYTFNASLCAWKPKS